MSDPFRNYDQWLQQGNPADEPDPEFCETCDQAMEWDVDVDVDEDTGRARACGGSWHCTNENCGKPEEPSEE